MGGRGVGWAASWPSGSVLPGSPSLFYPGSLGKDRGRSPWFWPPVGQNGTGPCDRCSRPPRRGLQPPSASLVFLYNKITGVTSPLVSGLALLGFLKREGGLRASGGTNKTGSVLGLPAPWRPSQPGVPSGPGVLWGPAPLCSSPTSARRECPFLTAHGQDVSPSPGMGVTAHWAARGQVGGGAALLGKGTWLVTFLATQQGSPHRLPWVTTLFTISQGTFWMYKMSLQRDWKGTWNPIALLSVWGPPEGSCQGCKP